MTSPVVPVRPVVLDVDGAVGPLPGEHRIPMQDWQETLRFGCSLKRLQHWAQQLHTQLPATYGTVFMGSGDFHHLSWPLIADCAAGRTGVRVVVLDNHPDNMRFPFGVHCGSWVRRVALMPGIAHVHVVGITSGDIGWGHAWENYLAPLRAGKLSYWSIGVDTGWSHWFGVGAAFRNFHSAAELTEALTTQLRTQRAPTYLSIDKDVFAPEVVRTNWDQGQFHEADAMGIVEALRGQLIGSDVTGDVSAYRYQTRWKRWLSAQDGQDTAIDAAQLGAWQAGQHALNERLVARIAQGAFSAL